mmetsp:Transcript_53032/g.124262  ORF Transcript_53032/g.124262 Transcript_53032/m.124262 type:complete len:246 (-) Transcript_53032:2111-2848(-)
MIAQIALLCSILLPSSGTISVGTATVTSRPFAPTCHFAIQCGSLAKNIRASHDLVKHDFFNRFCCLAWLIHDHPVPHLEATFTCCGTLAPLVPFTDYAIRLLLHHVIAARWGSLPQGGHWVALHHLCKVALASLSSSGRHLRDSTSSLSNAIATTRALSPCCPLFEHARLVLYARFGPFDSLALLLVTFCWFATPIWLNLKGTLPAMVGWSTGGACYAPVAPSSPYTVHAFGIARLSVAWQHLGN